MSVRHLVCNGPLISLVGFAARRLDASMTSDLPFQLYRVLYYNGNIVIVIVVAVVVVVVEQHLDLVRFNCNASFCHLRSDRIQFDRMRCEAAILIIYVIAPRYT